MTDDATLTDFDSSTDGDESADERVAGDSRTAESDGETPASTYAWGTYTCARCEATTERAWRDDGAFVCPECKSW